MEQALKVEARVVAGRAPVLRRLKAWLRHGWEEFLCSMDVHGEENSFTQNERGGFGGWLYQDVHYKSCSRCGKILERRTPGT